LLVTKFYVTTPIFYVNDAPHLGHAYVTVAADAVARWHRLLGDEVFFLTGTDEHGLKVAQSAEAAGRTPQEHADVNSARFKEAWAALDVSYDDFIRTTEERHHLATQALLQKAYDNGYIELDAYEGPYCVSCEGYYNLSELVDGTLCPIHLRPVEMLKEENYFFRLSRFSDQIVAWINSAPDVFLPETKRNEMLSFIRQGLDDISITRTSLTWGVPVPWAPGHVFYVWFDALINYATAIGYGVDRARFDAWWPAVHHLVGKEITRFHCVYWPALLLAAGEQPPAHVQAHGFLLVGGQKMSKTSLTGIAPTDLVPEFGVDGLRYQLLRDHPFGPDSDFSYEAMLARHNADLANNLGNLTARVATVVGSKCSGIGPAPSASSPLAAVASSVVSDAAAAWGRIAPSEALEATWRLLREANSYLEATEPWKLPPGPSVDAVLGDALEVLRIVAVLASPVLPRSTSVLWERLGLPGSPSDVRVPSGLAWGGYPGGLPVAKGTPLFPRLTAAADALD
jgi:methionyl-tRNA synthetase